MPCDGAPRKRHRMNTRQPLTLALIARERRLSYRSRLRLFAELRSADGQPVSGARVLFEAECDGSFRPVASATTSPTGTCRARLRAARDRRYRARVEGAASAYSAAVVVAVVPLLTARVDSLQSAARGLAVVSGRVRPRKRYVTIEVEQRFYDRWRTVDTTRVRVRGERFRARIRLTDSGVYRLRAIFAGDALNAPAVSDWLVVERKSPRPLPEV